MAGYKGTPKTWGQTGSRLLKRVRVQGKIDEARKASVKASIASREERQAMLTRVLRGETDEQEVYVVGIGEGCSDTKHVRKEVLMKDRLKALEILGKMHGDYLERVESKTTISGPDGGPVRVLTAEAKEAIMKRVLFGDDE
jgi:phage terminase small subunit